MKVGREYVGRGSSLKGGRTRKDNGREKGNTSMYNLPLIH